TCRRRPAAASWRTQDRGRRAATSRRQRRSPRRPPRARAGAPAAAAARPSRGADGRSTPATWRDWPPGGAGRRPVRAWRCRPRSLRLRAIDRDRDRAPAIGVEDTLQPPAQAVAQADQVRALAEGALVPALDQREAARAALEHLGGVGAVDETRLRPSEEDETWLMVARGGDQRIGAAAFLHPGGERRAREQRPHQRHE